MTPVQIALFDYLKCRRIPRLLEETGYASAMDCAQRLSDRLCQRLEEPERRDVQELLGLYMEAWAEDREAVFQAALSLGLEMGRM